MIFESISSGGCRSYLIGMSRERFTCRADSWSFRVNGELRDPTRRILVCCEFGCISTLATATLRTMGFSGAVALDGGIKAWREAGYPLETSAR
jgi:rhodanese-related sulfurtransferase